MRAIYHDTSKFSTVIWSVTLLLLAGMATPALSTDEDGVLENAVEAVSEAAGTVSKKSGETWDETKQSAGEVMEALEDSATAAGEYTREKSAQAWDATKDGTKKATDYTVEKSSQAWDATKETGAKVADTAGDTYDKVVDSLSDENETGVVVEDKSIE